MTKEKPNFPAIVERLRAAGVGLKPWDEKKVGPMSSDYGILLIVDMLLDRIEALENKSAPAVSDEGAES